MKTEIVLLLRALAYTAALGIPYAMAVVALEVLAHIKVPQIVNVVAGAIGMIAVVSMLKP